MYVAHNAFYLACILRGCDMSTGFLYEYMIKLPLALSWNKCAKICRRRKQDEAIASSCLILAAPLHSVPSADRQSSAFVIVTILRSNLSSKLSLSRLASADFSSRLNMTHDIDRPVLSVRQSVSPVIVCNHDV